MVLVLYGDITTSGGVIQSVTLNAGGLNYKAGDVLEITGGNGDGRITVATVKEDCIIQVNGLSNPAATLRKGHIWLRILI